MGATAVILGAWGGLLGLVVVLTHHLAVGFYAVPIASVLGSLVVLRHPLLATLLLGSSTFGWLLTGAFVGHNITFTTAAAMLLSGFACLSAAHEPYKGYIRPEVGTLIPPDKPRDTSEAPPQGSVERGRDFGSSA
jgi:hypothetical protein